MRIPRRAWFILPLLAALAIGAVVWLRSREGYSLVTGPQGALRPNFDSKTQSKILHANRVVFLVPFSHWDTDWHQTFDSYSQLADQNILKAIQLAKQDPRFRFSLEQVLFVQHFWETHPLQRPDLVEAVRAHQITFAWAGITQPETSLVAPSVQQHNLQLGRAWIAQTFGPQYVPRTAWQSDAFGNSAAFPTFLSQAGIPYLFIGRYQGRCDPDYQKCQPLPPAFYWTSPASPAAVAGRVLVAYGSYSAAWGDIYQATDPAAQIAALRKTIDAEFQKTSSKYLFLPVGFDFYVPQANLLPLVDRWNAADPQTLLVVSDPDSAFQYLASESLPNITIDLNPIWQAFYDTRPEAKIADKESEYYLTAADKFGLFLSAPVPDAWNTAAINAHYDNISGVSFDSVWNGSQAPRFESAVSDSRSALANILSGLAGRISAPVVIFNPNSWPRSGVVELSGSHLPDPGGLPGPVQKLGSDGLAFLVQDIPPVGYSALAGGARNVENPARVTADADRVALSNGLISVTIDAAHGAAFSSLALQNANGASQELLSGFGDDITYWDDSGDVYGAFFGQQRARESEVPAEITVLASGPLVARAQGVFMLGGQQVTKTVTVRAGDPMIEVDLDISALPNTTALTQTSTVLNSGARVDDLGFGAFEHPVDARPIAPGDVTYRRSIFYPVMYWSDVSQGKLGLTLITHGLQGVSGSDTRGLMLVREVTSRDEGLTDPGVHHLRYAYLPHAGSAADARPWQAAYDFNQPLIAAWRSGQQIYVQIPFDDANSPRQFENPDASPALPPTSSLISAQNGVITDLYRQAGQIEAEVVNYYNPGAPATIDLGSQSVSVPAGSVTVVPLPASTMPLPTP